ncbi:RiPP maturation radical SAM C-methyltransferase [Nonomuraea dietziae]|uniref:RiPP maturation radical SAM C-methyltransferase n=1 Tax=Nonomuraea dietziae TaxID=65515 RepID=UPI003445D656
MRLVLAAMPWQAIHRPSLPVGLLHRLVREQCPEIEVAEYHGGIRWAEYMLADGELAPADYTKVSDNGVFQGLGDLIFSGSLYDDLRWRADELREIAKSYGFETATVMRMRALTTGFIESAVTEVLASEPDVVGFTSTFMQNVPSLALARRLKELRPGLRVVFGGANCDGPMGHALHRNHRFVDFVVRGEGEEVFPALLDRIVSGEGVSDVPGLCWWDGERSMANPQPTRSVAPGKIPIPDFDGWRDALESSPLREYVSPELVVESSRGCWWGEKHHCTFCGLNGSLMAFRSKPADQFWTELHTLVERYQILDVAMVDNIFDMTYLKTLLPRLAAADWDLRIHYEIKSNMRADQLAALHAGGIVLVQPGIESLNSRVLKIMDKGVDGATNVRVLRDCEDHHMTVDWNYLYGFPGEQPEDYWSIIAQLPKLVHLQPPQGESRILLERFSPNFDRPELGFARREPAHFSRYVYDLPDAELEDLVYYFDCDDGGITGDVVDALCAALDRWRRDYPGSFLVMDDRGEEIVINDRRAGWAPAEHRLKGWQADAYRGLSRRRTVHGLRIQLEGRGHVTDDRRVREWLRELSGNGLTFEDGDGWIALATVATPTKLVEGAQHLDEVDGVMV